MKNVACAVALPLILALAPGAGFASPVPPEAAAEARNMVLLGSNDLQGRAAYQPTIHRQGERWIAYIGHHGGTKADAAPLNHLTGKREPNGTSIIDVTDPGKPVYLAHIPGEAGLYEMGGAQMTRVCDGKTLPKGDPNAVYLLRSFGHSAHEVWNTAEPRKPRLVKRVVENLHNTHKSWWECDTGIAFLVSGIPGWTGLRQTQVFDLSDPAQPLFIRNFGLDGQQPGGGATAPSSLHGPISTGPAGNRVYFAYGVNTDGIMQIVDRQKLLNGPKEPTSENLRAPEISRWTMPSFNGVHTSLPLLNMPIEEFSKDKLGKTRNFVAVVDEAYEDNCAEARHMVWFVDVTEESRPVSVSTYTPSQASGNFCSRGGRFGGHASNEYSPPLYDKRILFFTFFNAGVRAVDIRDPYQPREIGYYIPAVSAKTQVYCTPAAATGKEICAPTIQTNNVEVDDRGYIYIVDRSTTGLHILSLSGDALQIANLPR